MRLKKMVAATALLCASMVCAAAEQSPLTPPEHRRGPEQTFLTFPEWYLVHSPAEYAAYLSSSAPPSGFPLYAHIGQFWQSYGAVIRETKDYPFNAGYHVMVAVIGTSTTVEYAIKGLYENTAGRLSEATTTGAAPTPEEALAAQVAQEYVDFIRKDPWYLFDFESRVAQVWSLPILGPNGIRRFERRFALTCEYAVKAVYARIIKVATGTLYDAPKPVTVVVMDRLPTPSEAYPELEQLSDEGEHVIASIPRYEAFTRYSVWLARQGVNFEEVAGNKGEVVLSLLAPLDFRLTQPAARVLFTQPILTHPGRQRVTVALPVARLADLLRQESDSVRVEHVYDF